MKLIIFHQIKIKKMNNKIFILIIFIAFASCDDNRFNVPWFYLTNSSKCTMSNIAINSIDGGVFRGDMVISSYLEDFAKIPSKSYNSVTYTCTCEGKSKEYKQEFTPIELKQFEKYKITLDCSNSFIEKVLKKEE